MCISLACHACVEFVKRIGNKSANIHCVLNRLRGCTCKHTKNTQILFPNKCGKKDVWKEVHVNLFKFRHDQQVLAKKKT